jgi:putative transposase
MDAAHLLTAIRYVENNPVAAGLVADAGDWQWSSARSHLAGRLLPDDLLTDMSRTDLAVGNWRGMLRYGWEAGDMDADGAAAHAAIEARLHTGRPLAAPEWVAHMEANSGRALAARKRGPKPKAEMDNAISFAVPGITAVPGIRRNSSTATSSGNSGGSPILTLFSDGRARPRNLPT